MKKIVKLSGILSWFNLVCGSILVIGGLLMAAASPNILTIVTGVVLTSAIVLHSYAAIQLRKSIINPTLPLNRNTPGGIRFMGFMALFFGIWNFSNSIISIQNAPMLAEQMQTQLPAQYKDLHLNVTAIIRGSGIFALILSISIMMNVVINLRILRWYLSMMEDSPE